MYNTNRTPDGPILFASFRGEWSPLTAWSLAWAMLAMPCAALLIHFLILWNAVLLWVKGVPLFPHPAGTESSESRLIGSLAAPFMTVAGWFSGAATGASDANGAKPVAAAESVSGPRGRARSKGRQL